MIPEAPFLFSIAALSASLAGLAGLVAALRRGTELRPIDAFRLREIVEFAFANMLFCVGVVPLSQLLGGGTPDAVRVASVLALAYIAVSMFILTKRTLQADIARTIGWAVVAGSVVLANVIAAIAALVTGSIVVYQVLMVVMLMRPMGAFLLVLSSFESPPAPASPSPNPAVSALGAARDANDDDERRGFVDRVDDPELSDAQPPEVGTA